MTQEGRALVGFAADLERGLMTLQHMFDDGQSKPGAAKLTRARLVHPIKSFSESRNMLFGDAGTVVGHLEVRAFGVGKPVDANDPARLGVVHRIEHQVGECAVEL